MNIVDLLIIYLACGAPFGVHRYFNTGNPAKGRLAGSLFAAFLWIPYAIGLSHPKIKSALTRRGFLNKTGQAPSRSVFEEMQRRFEDHLAEEEQRVTLFEMREVLERYGGLTRSLGESGPEPARNATEFYRASGSGDAELPALCLTRRNRKRLRRHQKNARGDLLKLLNILRESGPDPEGLARLAGMYVAALGDPEAVAAVADLFEPAKQTDRSVPVRHPEVDLWKPETEPKRSIASRMPLALRSLTTSAARRRD